VERFSEDIDVLVLPGERGEVDPGVVEVEWWSSASFVP
jgi:hypothetical protein